ncbi:MAG: SpoIVB peptidase [Eubacteriales bacterium]|nr:SpoIVB peptidase [Eubacteriales bacterium]
MNSVKKQFLYRLLLYIFLCGALLAAGITYIHFLNRKIPEHIYINENQKVVLSMNIPATGKIQPVTKETSAEASVIEADLRRPVTFVAGSTGHYTLQINLFGFISYGKVNVDVVDEKYVYAGGFQIGMYLHTDGVYVVNTENIKNENGDIFSPWENHVAKGDYIVSADGAEINDKEDLALAVQSSKGSPIKLIVRRNGQFMEETIQPVIGNDNLYKIGLWVKDDAQGIGTITYVDENNHFAALGHGISDGSTGSIMEINEGRVYRTHVMSIVKGQNGTPGELIGAIEYKQYNKIGTIQENKPNGICGTLTENVKQEKKLEQMRVGYSYQIHEGNACVRFYYKGNYKDYPISIESISNGQEKNITFKVTSDELLELTNGIVQGMSGCPIIQDGNIVGAVTHVFVDDSTKGYGIFIESMLNKNN